MGLGREMSAAGHKVLRGIIPPMVTPLAGDDQLDAGGLEKLIEHMISGGVHGLFVLGTTGEGPSLSYRLRRELIQRTCRQVNRRIPVLVAVIDTSLTEALAMAGVAADSGADAIVAAPPYYFPLNQDDLVRWVTSIAAASPVPMYVYNVPNPKQVRYTLASLKRCADLPQVIGFKDSSGDFQFLEATLQLFRDRPEFAIFVGPEGLLANGFAAGIHGAISGGANAFPRLYVSLYDAFVDGRMNDVRVLQAEVDRFNRQVYTVGEAESSLLRGLKCCLSLIGICESRLCQPYLAANSQERDEIERYIRGLDRAHLLRAGD